MQLLHTADLHVGKRIHEASMLAEQRAILEQIAQLAIDRAVDGVLLAGDLYDKTIPTEEAVRLLDRFLTTLKNAEIPVFFISGNHDSAERLSFGWKILAQSGVYCSTPFSGTLQTIALEDSFGTVQITLLPFLKPAVVRPHFPDETIETYEDAVRCALSTVALDPSVRHVLLAHQLVTANGTQPERCDSETITVGGLDQVDVSLFDAFDYVALGSICTARKKLAERRCATVARHSSIPFPSTATTNR